MVADQVAEELANGLTLTTVTSQVALPSPGQVLPQYDSLTESQTRALRELQALVSGQISTCGGSTPLTDAELLSFLKNRNWSPKDAAAQIAAARKWRDDLGPVTIADVAPFLRTPPGRQHKGGAPDGCLVLLEDGRGGVARDNAGRPIVVSVGMVYGSALEMQKQMVYVLERAARYALPGHAPAFTCTIFEVHPRAGGSFLPSFRFPDTNTRALIDMQRRQFPGGLGSSTHFCGIPKAVSWFFRLCKPFMAKEAYDAMKLKPSYAHLPEKVAPKEHLLPHMGGTFDFDIDAYIEWRAAEEGIPQDRICPRGQGRTFGTAEEEGSWEFKQTLGTGIRPEAIADMAGELSAAEAVNGEDDPPVKHGAVQKRGSGVGVFGSTKWKTKLLVLRGAAACYFDSQELSDRNRAARIIPLGEGCQVARTKVAGLGLAGPSSRWTLVTPAREYLFGCDTDKEADAWVEAVTTEIANGKLSQSSLPG